MKGGTGGGGRPPLDEWDPAEADLLRGLFLEDAEERLARIVAAAAALAAGAAPEGGRIEELLRDLHTLKGAAGSVGCDAIAEAAHELEELCGEIRAGHLVPTPGILERVDGSAATLRALLDGARASAAAGRGGRPRLPAPPPVAERRRGPDRRAGFDRRLSDRSVRVPAERLDALLDAVADLVILRTRFERRLLDLEGVARDLGGVRGALRAASAGPTSGGAVAPDRVAEIERDLGNAVSHLDRASSALRGESEGLRRTTEQLEAQLRRARLQPLESVFARLAAAGRELERTTGRGLDVATEGGEIEVDKGVLDQLFEPLLHLLRNAVAHGIEPAPLRSERGKPVRGRIRIVATQEGESVQIAVHDDGGGIDREACRQALVRRGGLGDGEALPQDRLFEAIFAPGFSTRADADELAGRGMGLDIVRRAVLRLGGQVGVSYEPGGGTRFVLDLPLQASITQALLFKVGGQVYAIPAAHVVEIAAVEPGAPGGRRAPGDDPPPLLRLATILGADSPPGRHGAAIELRHGGRTFLAACDRVIGPRTIVVRPLGPLLAGLPLYAGVTISGAGKAQLVLDVAALAEAAHGGARPPATHRRPVARVLVVDDSRLSREAAARALAAAGLQPVTADDGWEAWELLGERRFDAVVTDLEMPRVDGFELIRRIRAEPTLRQLPIVVVSSRTAPAIRGRALEAGANVVLGKGPQKRALADAVRLLLRPAPGRA